MLGFPVEFHYLITVLPKNFSVIEIMLLFFSEVETLSVLIHF